MTLSNNLIINNSKSLLGEIRIPGDKSISHRSIILGSLADGNLAISNFLSSEDCLCTISAMKQLGADITLDNNNVLIKGKGLFSLSQASGIIDAGNSGTLIRLLTGILATQNFNSSITGDESLKSRPMARIIDPLTKYGAKIESSNSKAPLNIMTTSYFQPINYVQEIASAQVKSCLMLASLFIDAESHFYEEIPTRDHTENLLEHFNYEIKRDKTSFSIKGCQKLIPKDIEIGSDISSAAFFIVAALITKGSNIVLPGININKYRIGILTVLKRMGARININNSRTISNELVADIHVEYSQLRAIDLSGDIISTLIDELPILFIACAASSGTSNISGIHELRYKESDRIKAMESGLKAVGVNVSSTTDSIRIEGGEIFGGKVDSCDDHRIAMSFAIAGLISKHSLTVNNTKNIATSFPSFIKLMREQGVQVFEV
tara:strand:- start:2670 stop:3974 length:1305 start_codon:yes stop_codon:yes gene_type:complete